MRNLSSRFFFHHYCFAINIQVKNIHLVFYLLFTFLFHLFVSFLARKKYLVRHLQDSRIWIVRVICVNRFGENSPLWQFLQSFWQILEGLLSIWQNFDPTSARLNFEHSFEKLWCNWANVLVIIWVILTNNLIIWSH